MKKCRGCGTISQDADITCGVCGTNIANAPLLEGSIEDEIMLDQEKTQKENRLLAQEFAQRSRQRLVRRLLGLILALITGSVLLPYGIYLALSGYGNIGLLISTLGLLALLPGLLWLGVKPRSDKIAVPRPKLTGQPSQSLVVAGYHTMGQINDAMQPPQKDAMRPRQEEQD